MPTAICVTCGVQLAEGADLPAVCPICDDERQYIGHEGQQWTSLEQLRSDHHNEVFAVAPGLTGIVTSPRFAIGQQAFLIQTAAGNVLWECISLLDHATIAAVKALGGISAIAISHPHFYSSMVEWARAFDAPILLHADNQPWVMRPASAVHFWSGETHLLLPGLTIVRCGGHFPGSSVLHWADGAGGAGALLTGDTIYVVADRRYVSFMYSYPNLIPLAPAAVRRIVDAVEPYAFAEIYSSWKGNVVAADGKAALRRSAERYLRQIGADV